MPGNVLGRLGLNLDSLLVEEVQLLHGFTVESILQGVHVLHDVQLQGRLLIILRETHLQVPQSHVLVHLNRIRLFFADLVSRDAVLDLQADHFAVNSGKVGPNGAHPLLLSLAKELLD